MYSRDQGVASVDESQGEQDAKAKAKAKATKESQGGFQQESARENVVEARVCYRRRCHSSLT
jgi:hypothetical protein